MTDRELLQQALDMLDDINQCSLPPTGIPLPAEIDHVMEALRARLAQPDVPETAFGETEPVAWMHNFIDDVIIKNRPTDITCNAGRWTALYTAPPQREWVGLTRDEIDDIGVYFALRRGGDIEAKDWFDFYVAIEAKLKEKNSE